MNRSNLYLVRLWQARGAFRADVREVASEDTEVFWSRDELGRFFVERAVAQPEVEAEPSPLPRSE